MKLKILKILDVAIEYAIYALIFFIPISIARISIFAGIAVVLFLIKKILLPDFSAVKRHKIFFLILLMFFIFMALSLVNSGPLIGKGLKAFFIKWGRFPLLLWVILDTFQNARRVNNAAGVLVFSAMLVGFSVLSQKFFGLEFLGHRPLLAGFVTGPFKHQYSLAAYLTCVIPIVLSLVWKWRQIFVRASFLLIAIMLGLASFWTSCRGAWLGLGAGLIFFAFFINCRRVGRKLFLTVFSLSFLFCVPLMGIGLFFFQGRGDAKRFIIYNGAWKMITEHPFLGKGLGTFMDYCAAYTNNLGTYYVHNCFLQIWAESGIFALLSFLLLAGYVLYKSMKMILNAPPALNTSLLTGLTAGLVGFLVHSFFDVHLYSFQLSFLFWVILGLTVALTSCLDEKQDF